jgi:hypothetical protein
MQEGRKGGNMLEHEELTERIIQAALAVHRQLGPGFGGSRSIVSDTSPFSMTGLK